MQWTKWAFMIFYVTPCYSCEFCHIFKVVLVCVLWFCCASRLNDMNIYLVFWPYTSRPTSLLNTNRDMEFFFLFSPSKNTQRTPEPCSFHSFSVFSGIFGRFCREAIGSSPYLQPEAHPLSGIHDFLCSILSRKPPAKLSRCSDYGRNKCILKYPQCCHSQYKNELYYSVEICFVPLYATCMFLPSAYTVYDSDFPVP